MENIIYPIRINKYLAYKGLTTRKNADRLIEKGSVFVNGKKALLGQQIREKDLVEIKGNSVQQSNFEYFAYYKPRNVITHSPQRGEKDITTMTGKRNLFPIGRLDKDSEGLIILTNDGRITQRLLSPEFEHEKEYLVVTKTPVRQFFLSQMERGMDIGDHTTKPCKTKRIGVNSFSIILTEGKKHQIRRMCDVLSLQIETLKRIRVMNIKLAKMKPNELRKLSGVELTEFLASLGIDANR